MSEEATLVETFTLDFVPIYVYEYRGVTFGVHKTYRSSPSGWMAAEGRPGAWILPPGASRLDPQIGDNNPYPTRKQAVADAVSAIWWRTRPAPSETELARLIAEDYR